MSGQPTITTADRIRIGDVISVGGVAFKVVDIGALSTGKRRIQFLGSSHIVAILGSLGLVAYIVGRP